jgi:hypothetical protein
MFQLVAQPPAAPQVAQATDGVTNFFLILAVAAFAIVVLRLIGVGDLGGVTAVGGVIAGVIAITLVALLIFLVYVALQALLTF